MARRLGTAFLALVLAAVTAVAWAQSGGANTAADEAAIQQLWRNYEHYIEVGDKAAWLGLWMQDGVQMPPNTPMRVGLDEITAKAAIAPPANPIAFRIDAKEITLLGDWAYSRGLYTVSAVKQDGSETVMTDGKFMTILRRQDDGSWRIYRDIFNSNVAPE